MGVNTDCKNENLGFKDYFQQLKNALLAVKDDILLDEELTANGYTTTTSRGLRGFMDNWRTDNPTSDGTANDNDAILYELWQFCESKTDDELYALSPHYDSIIAEFQTKIDHYQALIDGGED
tara:strand:- start:5830 stop:6195 length:366 start_codon:yes stop_codon:yes gene_type:complete